MQKGFHEFVMLQKSNAQYLGVTAKQDTNGIGDNEQICVI